LAGDPDAPPIDVARATQGGLAVLAARVLGAGPLSGLAESSGTAYGLYLARRDGRRIDLGETLATARRDAQGLPAAAFPAALPAALARSRSPRPSEIEKRLRLTLAALTARI
jgi:hypothetical protein